METKQFYYDLANAMYKKTNSTEFALRLQLAHLKQDYHKVVEFALKSLPDATLDFKDDYYPVSKNLSLFYTKAFIDNDMVYLEKIDTINDEKSEILLEDAFFNAESLGLFTTHIHTLMGMK